jgi:predicted Zn-dependent protease
MFRRILPIISILSLLSAAAPLPARALSTQGEIAQGQAEDKDIVQTSVIETDPLLNAYANSIANKLWAETARKDIPYNLKIIKAQDVNSFATEGGYVYIYEGLIDFVQSDDEFASVIGHETGHIERRHVVTMQSKAQMMSILFGIASLFSPIIYNFGNLIQASALAKMSRADEIQADRYGLLLMSRAGYDPNAMVTMMSHLNVLEDAHVDVVDKYLAAHPDSKARVQHLMGYPELDPTKVTSDEMLVRALSDEERARYNIAALELSQILQKDPTNTDAMLKLGQAQLALGQTSKSEQTLSEASQSGNAQTRADAQQSIVALRDIDSRRVSLIYRDLDKLHIAMQAAQDQQSQAAAQIQIRRDEAKSQLKAINDRVQAIGYEFPDMNNVQIKPGSRLEALVKNLEAISRSLVSATDDTGTTIGGVGSVDKDKESGLLKENADILTMMQAPLAVSPIPSDSLAVLPSYPALLGELNHADGDMLSAIDASRAALLMTDEALGDLDVFLKAFQRTGQLNYFGDISKIDSGTLGPLMQTAEDSMDKAATAASQALQLYNMARSRQLSVRITMLGLGTSPERYGTLQYALDQRFHSVGIDYTSMVKQNLTPGDVTAATILAADVKSSPQEIIDEARANHRTMVDEANARGMHTWPLEIFMGLVYLDYTDDPIKEMHV